MVSKSIGRRRLREQVRMTFYCLQMSWKVPAAHDQDDILLPADELEGSRYPAGGGRLVVTEKIAMLHS